MFSIQLQHLLPSVTASTLLGLKNTTALHQKLGKRRAQEVLREAQTGFTLLFLWAPIASSSPRASLHGSPAEQPLLRPVLAMVWELCVVSVVTAFRMLQLQDCWALDRQGWPWSWGWCCLLAYF